MKPGQTRIQSFIEGEAVWVICKLMDTIQQEMPDLYYKSDTIMRAEDLLSYIEHHGINNTN